MTKTQTSDNTDADSKIETKELPALDPLAALYIGQTVHLVWPDKLHVPAKVITLEPNGMCQLYVFPGTGGFLYPGFESGAGVGFADYDPESKKIGTWHFIEGVE